MAVLAPEHLEVRGGLLAQVLRAAALEASQAGREPQAVLATPTPMELLTSPAKV